MSLQFKDYHDCVSIRPSMVRGTETFPRTVGVWPFRKVVLETYDIYEDRYAKWTCPECGSEWEYSPGYSGPGMWFAKKRNYEWKDVF